MGVPATVVTLLLASADAGTGNADSPAAHTIATSAETASHLGERTFASRRQPKARRTRAWTRDRRGDASGWVSNYPQMHFSRFWDFTQAAKIESQDGRAHPLHLGVPVLHR